MRGSFRLAGLVGLLATVAAGCGGGGSHNGQSVGTTSAVTDQSTIATNNSPVVTEQTGGGGKCSSPNPDPASVTFAGVICVVRQTSVDQGDGSTMLEMYIKVTNKDPNAFSVQSWDFRVLDSTGNSIKAGQGTGCIYQPDLTDGFPISPGQSLTLSGPLCFDVPSGYHAKQLVWQDDISVPLT
jgi:hypothetical protein